MKLIQKSFIWLIKKIDATNYLDFVCLWDALPNLEIRDLFVAEKIRTPIKCFYISFSNNKKDYTYHHTRINWCYKMQSNSAICHLLIYSMNRKWILKNYIICYKFLTSPWRLEMKIRYKMKNMFCTRTIIIRKQNTSGE